MRVFWPVTLAAALLVGLLAYGVFSKGGDTTLDEAVARGERPAAPVAALPVLGADGNASLADYKGKVVVLNVWASWCEPCRDEMPLLQETHEKIEKQGGVVLGIGTSECADAYVHTVHMRPPWSRAPVARAGVEPRPALSANSSQEDNGEGFPPLPRRYRVLAR